MEEVPITFKAGHAYDLRRFGILNENEDSIGPEDLADRMANSQQLDDALFVLLQELGHSLNLERNLDNELKGSMIDIKQAKTNEQLREIDNLLEAFVNKISFIATQVNLFDKVLSRLQILQQQKQLSFSPRALGYLREITDYLDRMVTFAVDNEAINLNKIREVQAVLNEKLNQLDQ